MQEHVTCTAGREKLVRVYEICRRGIPFNEKTKLSLFVSLLHKYNSFSCEIQWYNTLISVLTHHQISTL